MRNAKCRIIDYFADAQKKIQSMHSLPFLRNGSAPVILHFAFCILHFYSPMDCMMPFRATFMGSFSGSFAEGSPLQSQS